MAELPRLLSQPLHLTIYAHDIWIWVAGPCPTAAYVTMTAVPREWMIYSKASLHRNLRMVTLKAPMPS